MRILTTAFFVLFLILPKLYADSSDSEYKFLRSIIKLQALYNTGRLNEFNSEFKKDLNDEKNLNHLVKYAELAVNCNDLKAAQMSYKQILIFAPDNQIALKGLGVTAFYNYDFTSSEYYLKEYNNRFGGDYKTFYLVGVIYNQIDKDYAAEVEFNKSLKDLKQIKDKNLDEKDTEANLNYYLGNYDLAAEQFKLLNNEFPNDLSIKFDYINFLLNMENRTDAALLISTLPKVDSNRLSKVDNYNNQNDYITIELLKFRLCIQEDDLLKAQEILNNLKNKYPNNPQILISESIYFKQIDDWQKQVDYLKQAYALQTGNNSLKLSIKNAERPYSSRVALDNSIQFLDDNAGSTAFEYLITETLDARINKYFKVGAVQSQDYIYSKNIQQNNGYIGKFSGIRQQTELFGEIDLPSTEIFNSSTLILSYYLQSDYNLVNESGLGLNYTYNDLWGNTNLELTLRKPYWELPEAVIGGVYRDRAAIGRTLELIPDLFLTGNLGYNMYGMSGDEDLGKSLTFSLNAVYTLPAPYWQKDFLGENSKFTINYAIDSEIFFYIQRKDYSGTSSSYKVMPFQNRFIQTPSFAFLNQWTSSFSSNMYIGYAFDTMQINSNGIVFGVRGDYLITDNLSVYAGIDQSISVTSPFTISFGVNWYYSEMLNKIIDSN